MGNSKKNLLIYFLIFLTVFIGTLCFGQEANVHRLVKSYLGLSLEGGIISEGYTKAISGQSMTYHSSIPDVTDALITRASDGKMAIEWQTSPSQQGNNKSISFIWQAGLGVNIGEYKFDLFINDINWFTFTSNKNQEWKINGKNGSQLQFFSDFVDGYGDLFGYMMLTLPKENFKIGEPLHLKVVGERAQSNAWYMMFKNDKVVNQIQKTKDNGFWYILNWREGENILTIFMTKTLVGKAVRIQDSNSYNSESKLTLAGTEATASFSVSSSNLQHFNFPMFISLEGKLLDQLNFLQEKKQTVEYFKDGKVVYRSRSTQNGFHNLECSGNYFLNVVDGIQALDSSYFKKGNIHLITSSHQDIAWMDSPQNCIIQRDTMVITPALELLKKDTSYHYSIEQALMLKEYLERHPERLEEIAKYTRQGRLEWGASYNQPYEGMYFGESLIRQFYFGRKWIKKILPGCDSRTAWNLDVPGRTLQMPQIMKKSGVNYLLLSRHEKGFFYWQSPDGSRIGAHSPGHYHWASQFLRQGVQQSILATPKLIQSWEKEFLHFKMSPNLPVIFATDMSRPQDFSEFFTTWNSFKIRSNDWKQIINPKIPGMSYNIAEKVLDQIFENEPNLPVIKGERPNVWLYIHGPTHHRAITASREASRLLTAAEKFSTISSIIKNNLNEYPATELSNAWESHIFPDHGWGGKNGHITDSLFLVKSEFARNEGLRLLKKAINEISQHVKINPSSGIPMIVFNDLSWNRNDPVLTSLVFDQGKIYNIQLTDEKSKRIPFEIQNVKKHRDGSLKSADILFIAADVPSIGYKTFYVKPIQKLYKERTKLALKRKEFENNYYRISFANGGIEQIYDKNLQKDLFCTDKFLVGELFTMQSVGNGAGEFAEVQQPTMEGFDKLGNYNPKWNMIRDNDVVSVFELVQKIPHCTVKQKMTVYNQIKRIDFDVILLNWDGTKNREFRLAFPLKMKSAKITYEVPFGKVTVGEDEISGAAGERYIQPASEVHPREVQDWINASDQYVGFSVSSSVAVCDYIDPTDKPVDYPIIQPILLASRRSCHGEGNWYLQKGDHHFKFSIFSHEPGWENGYHLGKQSSHPLRAVIAENKIEAGFLPEVKSFSSLSKKNVLVSTIKKCEDDNSIILRCYEMEGKNTDVILYWFDGFETVEKTNLIEEEAKLLKTSSEKIRVNISHHKIETFKLSNSSRIH